jgi:hypothetical protein
LPGVVATPAPARLKVLSDRMPRVFIVQCLCPARHCIMATALEAESAEQCTDAGKLLLETLDGAIARKLLNGWCELCRAPREKWHLETGRTPWGTMAEAKPHLEASQREQLESARQLKAGKN